MGQPAIRDLVDQKGGNVPNSDSNEIEKFKIFFLDLTHRKIKYLKNFRNLIFFSQNFPCFILFFKLRNSALKKSGILRKSVGN